MRFASAKVHCALICMSFPLVVQAADLTISGYMRYPDATGGIHPVRYARVEIFDTANPGGDRSMGTTATGSNGWYSVTINNDETDGVDVFVVAYAEGIENAAFPGSTAITDVEDAHGIVYFMQSGTHANVTASSLTVSLTSSSAGDNVGSFSLFDAVVEAHLQAHNHFGLNLPKISSLWPEDGTYYWGALYFVQGDRYDRDVVLHEYGHYIAEQENMLQGDVGDSSAHSFNEDLRFFAAGTPITRTPEQAMNIAFREAFPTFFAVAGQSPSSGTTYDDTEDAEMSIDLEEGTQFHQQSPGQYYELMNVCVLWDLFDNHNSAVDNNDPLFKSLAQIWPVFHVEKPDNIDDFFHGWFLHLANQPEVYRIFRDHQMGSLDPALPVEIARVSAERLDGHTVRVRWQTASETKNAAWNILRTSGGNDFQTVNTEPVPGAGTAPFGNQYEFVDGTVPAGDTCNYILEWTSADGETQRSLEVAAGSSLGSDVLTMEEDEDGKRAGLDKSVGPGRKTSAGAPWLKADVDYVVIAPSSLKQAVTPLAAYRQRQGRRVAVVSVEDIYAQFPRCAPQVAIHKFLVRAYRTAPQPKLRYVLLVGDAAIQGGGQQVVAKGLLPTFVKDMAGVGLIPTDYPFACLVGADLIPEVAVGRLPVRTAKDAEAMVRKILSAEVAPANNRVIFTNGEYVKPGDEFAETSSESLIQEFCAGRFDVTRIYTMPVAPELQTFHGDAVDLKAAIESGCGWVEFKGHGAASLWAGLLDAKSAMALNNPASFPVVNSVSCFTAFFADNENRLCMAEALLRNPTGGAVAYIGNTGHGMVFTGDNFCRQLWTQVAGGTGTLGDAMLAAKQTLANTQGDKGFLHSINLFGDPATAIKLSP